MHRAGWCTKRRVNEDNKKKPNRKRRAEKVRQPKVAKPKAAKPKPADAVPAVGEGKHTCTTLNTLSHGA